MGDRGAALAPAPAVETMRTAVGGVWEDREEEMFGPAETLHSTYRLLRDEVLEGTMRAGGRLGELRLDTDLDVSHAVVRYLELLKLAALIERPEGQSLAEAVRDVNSRILQAVTAEQREIFTSSVLDDYLLDAERDARRRAAAVTARDDPSVESFLPTRGDGVVLSASDIDTYRTCPLKYKFARVFRIPQEPTVHQRFGIVVHQVLERFHAARARPGLRVEPGEGVSGSLPELLGLLDSSWRRGGFGDSEEERQLRGKAAAALTQYHTRFQSSESEPLWFERAFSFKLGPHLLRGRVDRVDRLPGGEYELIDYKTGRPKSAGSWWTTSSCRCTRSGRGRLGASMPHSRPTTTCSTIRRSRCRPIGGTATSGSRRSRWRSPTGSCRRGSSRRRRSPRARCATTGWCARPRRGSAPGQPSRAVSGSSSPRWRRKRWSSRAIVSPEGSGPCLAGHRRAAACSSRSTNACTSGSLCTARLTWRS